MNTSAVFSSYFFYYLVLITLLFSTTHKSSGYSLHVFIIVSLYVQYEGQYNVVLIVRL